MRRDGGLLLFGGSTQVVVLGSAMNTSLEALREEELDFSAVAAAIDLKLFAIDQQFAKFA